MPFIRGTYLTHPVSGVEGVWVELSTDPPGTLTGAALTAWPNPVTTGPLANRDTLETYADKINTLVNNLCRKTFGEDVAQVVVATVKFSSLLPLTLDPEAGVVVSEGDFMTVKIVRFKAGEAMGVLGLTYTGEE